MVIRMNYGRSGWFARSRFQTPAKIDRRGAAALHGIASGLGTVAWRSATLDRNKIVFTLNVEES